MTPNSPAAADPSLKREQHRRRGGTSRGGQFGPQPVPTAPTPPRQPVQFDVWVENGALIVQPPADQFGHKTGAAERMLEEFRLKTASDGDDYWRRHPNRPTRSTQAPRKVAPADYRRFAEWLDRRSGPARRASWRIDPQALDWARQEAEAYEKARADAVARVPAKLGGLTLYQHQREGAAAIVAAGSILVADEPGLGKTTTALAAVHAGGKWPLLVVCPNQLISERWKQDCEKMIEHDPQLQHGTIYVWPPYPKPGKNGAPAQPPLTHTVVILSTESLSNMGKRRDADKWMPQFGSEIFDECHAFKNPNAKRARYATLLARKHVTDDPMLIAMSGTPIVNSASDLRSQIELIGRSQEFSSGSVWKGLSGRYYKQEDIERLHRKLKGEYSEHPFLLYRKKSEVGLDLPSITYTTTFLEPNAEFDREYEQAQLAEFGKTEFAANMADLVGFLESQGRWQGRLWSTFQSLPILEGIDKAAVHGVDPEVFSSSSVNSDDDEKLEPEEAEWLRAVGRKPHYSKFRLQNRGLDGHKVNDRMRFLHGVSALIGRLKAEQCSSYIRERVAQKTAAGSTGKTIVFTHHRDAANILSASLNCESVTGSVNKKRRGEIFERFKGQAPALPSTRNDVVVLSLSTCSEGLTLTEADTVFFVEEPWTAASRAQARDRVHRIGQTSPVTIETLLMAGTLDEYKNTLVNEKEVLDAGILDGKWDENGELPNITRAAYQAMADSYARKYGG